MILLGSEMRFSKHFRVYDKLGELQTIDKTQGAGLTWKVGRGA